MWGEYCKYREIQGQEIELISSAIVAVERNNDSWSMEKSGGAAFKDGYAQERPGHTVTFAVIRNGEYCSTFKLIFMHNEVCSNVI